MKGTVSALSCIYGSVTKGKECSSTKKTDKRCFVPRPWPGPWRTCGKVLGL